MLDRLLRFFTSLKLTFVLLCLATLLVFLGTMAQDPLGLYLVQERFFKSLFVDAASMTAAVKKTLQMAGVYLTPTSAAVVIAAPRIPVFPGGYLLGALLLMNLSMAHWRYFKPTWKKSGIVMIHAGIVLLLGGQFATDLLSRESSLHLRVGEAKNYSESDRLTELAVIDTSAPDADKVVTIPDTILAGPPVIRSGALPFTIRVQKFLHNSSLSDKPQAGFGKCPATQGAGPGLWIKEEPRVTRLDARDAPSALIELEANGQSLGSWLVSEFLREPQPVTFDRHTYTLTLRLRRYYKPFSVQLLEFRHDVYIGTDTPKNFSSRVRVSNAQTGEDREVLIYMNNPLRYGGLTFYQASFDSDDKGSILQVVRNPGWLTPYLACVLVAAGMVFQFLIHLTGFVKKLRPA